MKIVQIIHLLPVAAILMATAACGGSNASPEPIPAPIPGPKP